MSLHREAPVLGRRHLRRRCVQCGLGTDTVDASVAPACPRCGCDMAARPPRSYAEMEGLFELVPDARAEDPAVRVRADAAAVRWLLVVAAVATVSAGTLALLLLSAGR